MPAIERLGRNLQFSALARVIAIMSSMFLTPFILKHVDADLFGLNALVISIVGYFNILDLGLGSGMARFTALFYGDGSKEKITHILCLGIKYFICLGLVVSLCLFLLSGFYENIFKIETTLIDEGRIMLLIYAVVAIFTFPLIPFRSVLNGLQRVDIISKINVLISVLNIPAVVLILIFVNSYLLYIGTFQLLTVLFSLMFIFHVLRYLPDFRLNFTQIPSELRGKLLNYSGWYFAAGIIGIIIFQIDNLVIATFLSVNAVTLYTIAYTVHNYIRSLNSFVGNSLYTIIIAEFAKRSESRRNSMILNVTRMHSGLLLPLVIIAFIGAENFIIAWVGDGFSYSILPCRILLSYWFFNITTEILFQGVVGGKGLVIENVKIEAFVAIANLALSLLLIRYMGIAGVALGTSIPYILGSSFYVYRFCNILNIPVYRFLLRGIVPNLPHYFLVLILSIFVQDMLRGKNVIQILVILLIIYIISVIPAYLMLSDANRSLVKRILTPVAISRS